MRIGLVGLGRIGAFHARTLLALDTVDELLVTDSVPAATAALVAELGVSAAASPADLLTAELDGVVIASSTSTHPQLLLAFVEAGIPAFCEKPVAGNLADAIEVRNKTAHIDVPVQIGFPRRFDPDMARARDDLQSGRLGKLHTLRSTTLDPAPPPAAYILSSGGIFRDCAIHDFDTVRWVTGREVIEVYAVGSSRIVDYIAEAHDADTATSLLTLDDGSIAVISNARRNGRGHDVRLELLGTDDSVAAGLDQTLPLRSANPSVPFPTGPPSVFFMDRFAEAFRRELAMFTEVAGGSAPSPCTVEDGVEASRVAEACARSWQEHRPVGLDEIDRG